MSDITAAIDETAANVLIHDAEAALGSISKSGSGSLGPFVANWGASASLTGGTVVLTPPDVVSLDNCQLNYNLSLSVGIDLSFLDFCLPRVCIPTPWGDICTPTICITFPTITVPLSFSNSLTFSADFGLNIHLTAGQWNVDVVILAIPTLDLGPAATLLLSAIGAAIALAVAAVPFIGPILSIAVAAIVAAFGLAEVTGLLGAIVTLFVSGLTLNVYQQPQNFQVLPAAGPFDPAVSVTLLAVGAAVQGSDKNELVLSVDI